MAVNEGLSRRAELEWLGQRSLACTEVHRAR